MALPAGSYFLRPIYLVRPERRSMLTLNSAYYFADWSRVGAISFFASRRNSQTLLRLVYAADGILLSAGSLACIIAVSCVVYSACRLVELALDPKFRTTTGKYGGHDHGTQVSRPGCNAWDPR